MLSVPLRRSLLRAPAGQALFIQSAALALVLLLASCLSAAMGIQVTVAFAVFLQGAIAALLARWFAMAWWWWLIQFLFPVALMTLHAVSLPPWIYLAAFTVLLALYWSTFRTQVPYYPSRPAIWNAVAALLPQAQALRVIDVGSGFGGLAMHLAALRQDCKFVGIEVAPLPWLASLIRARLQRNRAHFVRGDYVDLDLADYDVVFAYLSPAAMPALWRKACAEMRQGTLLLSCEFSIPDAAPDIVVRPPEGGPPLYGWHIG